MAYAFSASQREKTRRIALPEKMYAVLSWFGLNGGATHFDSLKTNCAAGHFALRP